MCPISKACPPQPAVTSNWNHQTSRRATSNSQTNPLEARYTTTNSDCRRTPLYHHRLSLEKESRSSSTSNHSSKSRWTSYTRSRSSSSSGWMASIASSHGLRIWITSRTRRSSWLRRGRRRRRRGKTWKSTYRESLKTSMTGWKSL